MDHGAPKTIRWAALVPAGGIGLRMKGAGPKQLMNLGDRPVLIRTLERLLACPELETVVAAVPAGLEAKVADLAVEFRLARPIVVITGGETRQHSVWKAFQALEEGCDYVLVHDGVRPLVPAEVLHRTMEAAQRVGAATAAVKVQDTLAEVDKKGFIDSLPSRTRMWQIQTPQAFWRPILKEAHEQAWADDHIGTDEAGLVVRLGRPVAVVEGSPVNLKLTTPHDLTLALALLARGED